MPENCKNLFLKSMTQDYDPNEYKPTELNFLKTKRTLDDYKVFR